MSLMRMRNLLSLLAVCCSCSGCSVAKQLGHTVGSEMKYRHAEHRVMRQERDLAGRAWTDVRKSCPEVDWSRASADGFRDGFAACLHTGCMEPPPVPPERYWRSRPDGLTTWQAAQDWFNGYRLGANAASQGSGRTCFVVPTSTPCCPAPNMPPPVSPREVVPPPEPLAPDQAAFRPRASNPVVSAAYQGPPPGPVAPAVFLPPLMAPGPGTAQPAVYREMPPQGPHR